MQKIQLCGVRRTTSWLCVISSLAAFGCGTPARAHRSESFSAAHRRAEARSRGHDSAPANFEKERSLDRDALIRAVLAQNPSVEAARQSWRAARARQVQQEAWPDPVLSYSFAPLSIASGDVPFGQQVQLSQRIPWPGKLGGRGEAAEALADAAGEDYIAVRRDLALQAALLYADFWLVDRALEINGAHQTLLSELKQSAEAQYSVGRASFQDPLQAEVELSQLVREALVLRTQRETLIASLNALLHRMPNATLPSPPVTLEVPRDEPPASATLQRVALEHRTELEAIGARVRAAEARTEVAGREYYPDVTVMASYSSMWREPEHQWMLGLSAPIPIQVGARAGAEDEASAESAEARSDLARTMDEIRREVETARARVIESLGVVTIYDQRLLPAARDQVAAARAGFEAGTNSFVAVIDAEKNLRSVELARLQSLAVLSQRWATLERALGRTPGIPLEGGAQ